MTPRTRARAETILRALPWCAAAYVTMHVVWWWAR